MANPKFKAALVGVSLTGLFWSSTATALPTADPAIVVVSACQEKKDKSISRMELLHSFMRANGISSSNFVATEVNALIQKEIASQYATALKTNPDGMRDWQPTVNAGEAMDKALIEKLKVIADWKDGSHPADNEYRLKEGIGRLIAHIQSKNGLQEVDGSITDFALFISDMRQTDLICKVGSEAGQSIVTTLEEQNPPPKFAIRSKPEELWLGGQAGRKAGSFKLGFDRQKSILDDGSSKTDSSLSVDGVVGVRISADTSDSHAYLFAGYSREKKRTRPAPTLAAGSSQSDGDKDVLTIGFNGNGELTSNDSVFKVFMNASVAGLFDFKNDANRLITKGTISPAYDLPLGICRFGGFLSFDEAGSLSARCTLDVEFEGARVLKKGSTELGNYDNFMAVGFNSAYELFLPTSDGNDESGFLGAVRYRLLPVIRGPQKDIERFEAELKHRFWSDIGVGVDVGFLYAKGDTPLTYEDEDSIKFSVGIVY